MKIDSNNATLNKRSNRPRPAASKRMLLVKRLPQTRSEYDEAHEYGCRVAP